MKPCPVSTAAGDYDILEFQVPIPGVETLLLPPDPNRVYVAFQSMGSSGQTYWIYTIAGSALAAGAGTFLPGFGPGQSGNAIFRWRDVGPYVGREWYAQPLGVFSGAVGVIAISYIPR